LQPRGHCPDPALQFSATFAMIVSCSLRSLCGTPPGQPLPKRFAVFVWFGILRGLGGKRPLAALTGLCGHRTWRPQGPLRSSRLAAFAIVVSLELLRPLRPLRSSCVWNFCGSAASAVIALGGLCGPLRSSCSWNFCGLSGLCRDCTWQPRRPLRSSCVWSFCGLSGLCGDCAGRPLRPFAVIVFLELLRPQRSLP
jgi:hypothetical protein